MVRPLFALLFVASVAYFTRPDASTGQPWGLAEAARDKKATVVSFLATGCPVSNATVPKLLALAKRHKESASFVAVYAHPADNAADAAAHAKQYGLTFPAVHDAGGKLAKQFNVDRVPTVFVLDGGLNVRYMGRVDDQDAPGVRKATASTKELAQALAAVIDGREVTVPYAEPAGCKLLAEADPAAKTAATYHSEIARIIQAKCQACHRPGEAAPFALMTYKDAKSWAGMIREVVADGVMPPWHADAPRGHFRNDRRLSDADKATLLAWIDAGCPEGDPKDEPPAKTYTAGWRLPREPDLVIKMAKTIDVPAQFMMGMVGMPYQYVQGETKVAEDTWVSAVEVRPDLRAAIHHIIVFVIPPDQKLRDLLRGGEAAFSRHMLTAYVPGDEAQVYPEGMAKFVPKGSTLLFEVHYTPNGKAGRDRSAVGMVTTKTPPATRVRSDAAITHRLSIPPGAANYSPEIAVLTFDKPVTLLDLTPHMHVRGKAFRFDLVTPDGKRETLLNVPKYDFNWQVGYALAAPRKLPAGSRIECQAWYDNSAGNPANPDPSKRVTWGNQTWEEMMIGFVEYLEETGK
jgi:thiol-disulfide isomerase/thioredoxin